MEGNLQELTATLMRDGVEKGEAEAASLIEQANEQAASIIAAARKEADEIQNTAQKESQQTTAATKADLQLRSQQILAQLKQDITNAVQTKIMDGALAAPLSDSGVIADMLKALVSNKDMTSGASLEALLPENSKAALEASLQSSLQNELSAGLQLRFSDALTDGFQVQQVDGGYRMSFTEADLTNYFQSQLRPKVQEILFN